MNNLVIYMPWVLVAALFSAAVPGYKVSTSIKIGGEVRWDDLFVDSANHRAYISHNSQVEVIDTESDKPVGTIPDTPGVHGIAIANDLGKGFISFGSPDGPNSDGAAPTQNSVLIFDLKSLKAKGKAAVGQNPDAISYDVLTHRVVTFNDRSNDATVIDAKTEEVVALSVPLGGKPAFSQADGQGNVYVNVADGDGKQFIVALSMKDATVTKRYATDPCADSSGLAMDLPKMRLYTACGNRLMVISDPVAGKVIGTAPIGAGPDSITLNDGYAFTPHGQDGTISMVGDVSPGKFNQVAVIPMAKRARIIGADTVLHKLYVPAAEYGEGARSRTCTAEYLQDRCL